MQDKPDKPKPARDVRENPVPNPDGKNGAQSPERTTPPAKRNKNPPQPREGVASRGAL